MSFSSNVKSELCQVRSSRCCRAAELCGIIFMCGSLTFGRGGLSLILATEHKGVITRAVSLFAELYGITCDISQRIELKTKETYLITVPGTEDVTGILRDNALSLGAGITTDEARLAEITEKQCCKAAFLRGAFLGSGSVGDPNKIYHLEFVASMQELAECVLNILNECNLKAGIMERKGNAVVYMKDMESISSFMALTGAAAGVLELENIRILKDIRNNVNRQINCENANIDKTVRSALGQLADINAIIEGGGMDKLSRTLREAAEIRLAYPESSLSELSEMLGVSRSGLYHRFKKLALLAEDYQGSRKQ